MEFEYQEIEFISEATFKDKGSRFVAKAIPQHSEQQIKETLQNIKKEYYDARHHCYAYVLGEDKAIYRTNDDGEPSGTAAKPIHGQILSYNLTNILIVVVRYFGGTKLGVSGLINAYKTSAKEAIENNKIITKTTKDIYLLEFDYQLLSVIMKIVKDYELEQLQSQMENNCKFEIAIMKKDVEKIIELFKSIYGLSIKKLRTQSGFNVN